MGPKNEIGIPPYQIVPATTKAAAKKQQRETTGKVQFQYIGPYVILSIDLETLRWNKPPPNVPAAI